MTAPIVPVILSGGAGSRLWPLSTPARPKQFLAIAGEATMLQRTALRVADRSRFSRPLILCSTVHAVMVSQQLAAIGVEPSRLILEPCGRNTAAAIAIAALDNDPDSLLLVMPSDHLIDVHDAFQAAINAATALASQGWLVTFGIRPDAPETGFGYIAVGDPIDTSGHAVRSFVEKPDHDTAARYLDDGGYLWNSGIFLFKARDMIDALARHAPDILDGCREVHAREEGNQLILGEQFETIRSESIDRAVMERSEQVAVVPATFGWSDVGSWDAWHAAGPQDMRGNVTSAASRAVDCDNCLLIGEGRQLIALGVRDLIVVETAEAILIVPRGQSQRLGEAREAIRSLDRPV